MGEMQEKMIASMADNEEREVARHTRSRFTRETVTTTRKAQEEVLRDSNHSVGLKDWDSNDLFFSDSS